MADILHRVGIKSSLDEVCKALTTREGLLPGGRTTHRGKAVGGVLQFRFGAGGFDMKVLELHPPRACYGKWSMDPQNGSAPR
jgi:hypothetical protein